MTRNYTPPARFIYWFAYYNLDSPSVRYRGKIPLEYLEENYGVHSFFVMPGYKPAQIFKFLKAYFSALILCKSGSIIVIQRIHSGFIYSMLLKLLVKIRTTNTYYDLDDADYLEYPPKNIYYFLRNCSGAYVGSHELVKNLTSINRNIILNTSPTPDPLMVKSGKNSVLTIGWIGDFGGGHREALLKYFFPALKNLSFEIRLVLLGVGRKDANDFKFLADYFHDNMNIDLKMPRNIDWNNEEEIQRRITEFDIGIATLMDTEFHLSKSAFKLKQYLNNGVPVLSSNLPENNYFIQDGINGYLCRTPEQFRQRIAQFNEMPDEVYMRFSLNARKSCIDFNLTTYCETLITGKGQLSEPINLNLKAI